MTDTVSHVDATFGGRPIRFELKRDHRATDELEGRIGSISAAWGRFRSGDWTVADVRAVLTLAHPLVPVKAPVETITNRLAAFSGQPPTPAFGRISFEAIDVVIQRRPLATYAPLAAAVLTAAFLGLPKNAAVFDEGARIIAAPEDAGAAA